MPSVDFFLAFIVHFIHFVCFLCFLDDYRLFKKNNGFLARKGEDIKIFKSYKLKYSISLLHLVYGS